MTDVGVERRRVQKVSGQPVVSELRASIATALQEARAAQSEISSHERECAIRYAQTAADIGEIKDAMVDDRAALKAERDKVAMIIWSMIGSIALLGVGLIGWMAVQLYTLEPLRVQASRVFLTPAAASAPR